MPPGNGIAVQQPHQLAQIEMRSQQVAPTEVQNRAMAGLAVPPKGFEHSYILVGDTLAAGARTTFRNIARPNPICPRE
ncbi:MAG: hypothetical protein ACREN3_06665 [Gemmatimonadaceae bacterium]